jgi:hypothetical protein
MNADKPNPSTRMGFLLSAFEALAPYFSFSAFQLFGMSHRRTARDNEGSLTKECKESFAV